MRNGENYAPGLYTADVETVDLCLNCTEKDCPGDCQKRRRAAGLCRSPKKQETSREDLDLSKLTKREREFVALYDEGLNDMQCSKRMGCADTTVWYIRSKLGLPAIGRYGAHKKKGDTPN